MRGAGVEAWPQGVHVCAFVGHGQGALADYVAVPASALAGAPAGRTIDAASAIPLAALTAWQGLFDHGKLQRGERVLIQGASGAVGRFAVQFAHQCGAHVVATASTTGQEVLMRLGANEVIDYHRQRFEESTEPVDLVFDLVGGATQERSWQLVKTGGTMVSTFHEPSRIEARRHRARAMCYTAHPAGEQLAHIIRLFEEGAVAVDVVERYGFDDLSRAFGRLIEAHVHGKLVVLH